MPLQGLQSSVPLQGLQINKIKYTNRYGGYGGYGGYGRITPKGETNFKKEEGQSDDRSVAHIKIICHCSVHTGCSLNIVIFLKIFEYSGLWSSSVFPRCQCVYTHQAGRTPALQLNWQSSEKI